MAATRRIALLAALVLHAGAGTRRHPSPLQAHDPPATRRCDDPDVANAACFLPGQSWTPGVDTTAAIRAALATNKSLIVIPRMPTPWIVSTAGSIPGATGGYCPGSCYALQMSHQSNMTILFEPGAEVQAKRGDWHAPKMASPTPSHPTPRPHHRSPR